MAEMYNAKEMQDLLQVDRSTIYRMAEDGRLPAIKVGKQWRFPADRVNSWLQIGTDATHTPGVVKQHSAVPANDLEDLLPLECVQLIQDSFSELLGVMLVITDMTGNPITRPSNPCGLFQTISRVPHSLQRCIKSWHKLAVMIDLEPHFNESQLKLRCTRALIRDGAELKGMVVAGCVAPDNWPPTEEEVAEMAAEFGVTAETLNAHLDEVYFLDRDQQQRVLNQIQQIANIVAHIISERKTLIGRLEAIADLSTI